MKPSTSASKDEWLTPEFILELTGPYDLDPCAPVIRPWPTALRHYTIEDNGLVQVWQGRAFVNPPYGNQTGKWLARCAEYKNATALIFARTETDDWFEYVWPAAHAILFLRSRLFFHHVDGARAKFNAGAPSALVAYDEANSVVLERCGIPGKFIRLR